MTSVTSPGLAAGTWVIDPVHSAVSFSVRHLNLAAMRGGFGEFSGEITVGDDALASAVRAEISIGSLNTLNGARDGHLLTGDFFDAEKHPTATFVSTGIAEVADGKYTLQGELTLKGVTKQVDFELHFNGTETDPQSGADKAGFSAVTEILRSDFGVGPNIALPSGKLAIGDKTVIELEIQAALAS
jgi:polyisoprenoid-binding protein YceI